MRFRSAWAGWFLVAAVAWAGDKDPGPIFPVRDLKAGGFVVFFRHAHRAAYSRPGERQSDVDNRGVCMPGTELDRKGRKDVEKIRRGLLALEVPIERVYASTTCRTRQMAEILAPTNLKLTRALVYPKMYRGDTDTVAATKGLHDLLTGPFPAGTNRLLISHAHVLDLKALGIPHEPAEGEAVVLARKPGGGARFAGYVRTGDWPAGPARGLLRR